MIIIGENAKHESGKDTYLPYRFFNFKHIFFCDIFGRNAYKFISYFLNMLIDEIMTHLSSVYR